MTATVLPIAYIIPDGFISGCFTINATLPVVPAGEPVSNPPTPPEQDGKSFTTLTITTDRLSHAGIRKGAVLLIDPSPAEKWSLDQLTGFTLCVRTPHGPAVCEIAVVDDRLVFQLLRDPMIALDVLDDDVQILGVVLMQAVGSRRNQGADSFPIGAP